MSYISVEALLQAFFGSDNPTDIIFTNLKPHSHTRDWHKLDQEDNCYLTAARFKKGVRTNRLDAVTEIPVLILDDVGTAGPDIFGDGEPISKVKPEQARKLGEESAIIRTSQDNHHYWFKLSRPVLVQEWEKFRRVIEDIIGVEPDCPAASALFRAPFGRNTKRGGVVEPIKLVDGTVLDVEALLARYIAPKPDDLDKPSIPISGGTFWHRVNELALANLDAWVPEIFPDARYQGGTRAWRVSSHSLGRELEEDLSLSPKGIKDFGVHDIGDKREGKRTAIDIVTEYGEGVADSKAAAFWLCERCGADPAALGWISAAEAFQGVKTAPHMLSWDEFITGFVSPDYLVKKLITKSFLYSLTGQTGAGKTSITLRLAATVALGRSFGGLGTKKCRVLYLAAENPVDIRMRCIALAREMGFEGENISVIFIEGNFRIGAAMKELQAEALRIGGEFGLVVVDTGPVFFEGEDENDRVAMRRHARMLRELIEVIPGRPAVIVNMHPTKNAGPNDLTPAGGGSFLNEVDGNLTAAKNSEEQSIELHWQGKWRGVEFAPLDFVLKTVEHPRIVDSDGDPMPTVVCDHISMAEKEVMEQAVVDDQSKILAEMIAKPRISLSQLAVHMGWYRANGSPDKSKVDRRVKVLEKKKLVKKDGELWAVKGAPKSKLNGCGGTAVPAGTVRPGTTGTNAY